MVELTHQTRPGLDELSRLFRYFGEVETPKMDSPVYTAYCLGIADDPDLLALAQRVLPGQPAPNVLFAAVQDLLLEDPERSEAARALARFYPSISGQAIPDGDPWAALRSFCHAHRSELLPGIESGRTQTCVVHRCAVMLPAISQTPRVREAGGRVGLLEIGPSAGLNLRLDHYRYVYRRGQDEITWGGAEAKPVLECEVRSESMPPLPGAFDVVARRGLELAPLDVTDPRALRWLRALVWPEHVERARLMDEALDVVSRVPAMIEAGDATRDVGAAIARLPSDAPRVLFATQVLYQISKDGIDAMLEGMARASLDAPVDFIAMESDGRGESRIDWYAFENGEAKESVVLAHADSHGRWIDWGRQPRGAAG